MRLHAMLIGLLLSLAGWTSAHSQQNPVVQIETSMGNIKIELFADKAPITVKNYLNYVEKQFYDGTLFHRVIPNFMIQGGGINPDMSAKTTEKPIKNESGNGLKNSRGTLAMARTNLPNSATAQFFINLRDNRKLDPDRAPDGWGYCVFGKVIEGMDVVDKIQDVPTTAVEEHKNVPKEPVVIKSIRKIR